MTNLKFISAIAFTATIFSLQVEGASASGADYIFLLDREQHNCQQIGDGYQEIRAFETDNHIVSICQKDDSYYYLGETKTERADTIFLPANALSPGEMYRANNGNLAYIVTILPKGATLTIERNGGQIAHELSLPDFCAISQQDYQTAAVSPSQISEIQILIDHSDLQLSRVETIALSKFDRGQAFLEYQPETVLSLSSCHSLN